MHTRLRAVMLTGALSGLLTAPLAAADKETLQMMADIRMLQEQTQQIQILLGTLGEAIKAVNARIDAQAETARKSFADQKLNVDTLGNDLRIVREKIDDNNVRIGSLTQELEAMRQSVLQLSVPPPAPPATADPAALAGGLPEAGAAGAVGAAVPPPAAPAAPPPSAAAAAAISASPQQMWDLAFVDYTAGQYDLAVWGYESFIRSFPKDERADNAQVYIATAYLQLGNNQKALEAADGAIRNYPGGDALPEAYYRKGIALQNLRQLDGARQAYEYIIKAYPDHHAAILAKQALDKLKQPQP
jgi:TolA-binding protein